jgi:activator of HSP90 ATPase
MSIHQEIIIKATPKAVYEILTNASKFKAMTGGRAAKISKSVGGEVSLFDGAINAVNIELLPGKRLVQAWRAGNWPEGVHSIVRFEFSADGTNTKLNFDQSGHPESETAHLEKGWYQMYWNPMNAMLAKA